MSAHAGYPPRLINCIIYFLLDEKQYQVHILIYNSAITLNDDKTQFVWGDKEIIFTKRA
jgi:hypothetical protein